MPKEKQITCLADLMEYEISEFDDMWKDGLFDEINNDDNDVDNWINLTEDDK